MSKTSKPETQTAYESTPEQKKYRRDLGRARYAYEKKNGALPDGVDLHHKKPARGGGGEGGNLEPVPASKHRGWNKGRKGK